MSLFSKKKQEDVWGTKPEYRKTYNEVYQAEILKQTKAKATADAKAAVAGQKSGGSAFSRIGGGLATLSARSAEMTGVWGQPAPSKRRKKQKESNPFSW